MESIFFPPDLDPSSGQDIFHGGAIKLGKLLIDFIVREESFPKGIKGSLLVAK